MFADTAPHSLGAGNKYVYNDASMQFSIPHKLRKEEAKAHVDGMLKKHEKDIAQNATGVVTKWKGDTLEFAFTAQSAAFSGTLSVRESEYELHAKLPLRYKLFEGTIERMIKGEIAKLI